MPEQVFALGNFESRPFFSGSCKNSNSIEMVPQGTTFNTDAKKKISKKQSSHSFSSTFSRRSLQTRASILGGMEGGTRPQFLEWGDEYLIVPPHFFICSMKFNSTLFSAYCGHCLSLSILLITIQIQTRSHMLTQSCFFSNFLRCYC